MEIFLDTHKISYYSIKQFVYVQEYLTNRIYMYYNHLPVKLTFCALLTLGVCANAMLL